MRSATLIVKTTRREVRANHRRCSVEGLGSRCVLRALWVSVVLCVSESMGCMAPANLASFSLHKQNGRGVRAGRPERAERLSMPIQRSPTIFTDRRALVFFFRVRLLLNEVSSPSLTVLHLPTYIHQ